MAGRVPITSRRRGHSRRRWRGWQSLLQRERIGRHDDFFALGGHSLLAVQCCTRIRQQLGRELALRTLFEAPLSHPGAASGDGRDPCRALPLQVVDRHQPLPLSWPQQRLWFIDQLEGAGAAYTLPFVLQIDGPS